MSHGFYKGYSRMGDFLKPMMRVHRELQNEKLLSTVGFEPGTFRLRSERAKRWAIRADKYRSPKGDHIWPECAINSYLYRVVECFVV